MNGGDDEDRRRRQNNNDEASGGITSTTEACSSSSSSSVQNDDDVEQGQVVPEQSPPLAESPKATSISNFKQQQQIPTAAAEQSPAPPPPEAALNPKKKEEDETTVALMDDQISLSIAADDDDEEFSSDGEIYPKKQPKKKGGLNTAFSRRSSIEMRKSQSSTVDMLRAALNTSTSTDTVGGGGIGRQQHDSDCWTTGGGGKNQLPWWKRQPLCCLHPRYSLRTQLMLTFGSVSWITILFVLLVCMIVAYSSGQHVKSINQASFEELFTTMDGRTARYLAESLTPRLVHEDVINILHQAVSERFAGYPDAGDDEHVPFLDSKTQTNQYPLIGKPLPLDWQQISTPNVNEQNAHEHVQDRWSWYAADPALSTASAVYYMQGMCNPAVADDPRDLTHWPRCSDEHNNITSGGALQPTSTNAQIYQKASDLQPLLKALYEYHTDVKIVGVFFANSGAGSTLNFPHFMLQKSSMYPSIGCDWMAAPNPYKPHRPIATPEEISRCHPKNELVSSRAYNPLERDWCRVQALEPEKLHIVGPFLDAWHHNQFLIGSGRAVYDPVTSEFVACLFVASPTTALDAIVQKAKVTNHSSEVTVTRWDEVGTVVATTAADLSLNVTKHIAIVTNLEERTGVDAETYQQMYTLIDYDNDEEWDPAQVRQAYESFTTNRGNGYFVSVYPIPPVPDDYDETYRPEFLVIMSTRENGSQLEQSVSTVNDTINKHVQRIFYISLILACAGLVLATLIILLMSSALTAPMGYMNSIANDIVENVGQQRQTEPSSSKDDESEDDEEAASTIKQQAAIDPADRLSEKKKQTCRPHTELDDVVEQFNLMVLSFSGKSITKPMAAQLTEIPNDFSLQEVFADLYASRRQQRQKKTSSSGSSTTNNGFSYPSPLDQPTTQPVRGDHMKGGGPNHGLGFTHFGRNLTKHHSQQLDSNNKPSRRRTSCGDIQQQQQQKWQRVVKSPLFLWTILLIATPLLLTTIALSALVMTAVTHEFGHSVDFSKQQYVGAELHALGVYARLRADLVSIQMERPVRDLHLLQRYASWLLFGGVNKSQAFPTFTTGIEVCKEYPFPNRTDCPYVKNTYSCECDWEINATCPIDLWQRRPQQLVSMSLQAQDLWPDGTRNRTSFPKVAASQNATKWQVNQNKVPGWNMTSKNNTTTYDRLRAVAAIPIMQVLHNHDTNREYVVGRLIAMEQDGMSNGYYGCITSHAGYSYWNSTEKNGAFVFRPELCPKGKYGYDPRCRGWYHKGRTAYLENSSNVLHVTPPYKFSSSEYYAQSVTAALFEPQHGSEHVGQVVVDYVAQGMVSVLNANNTPLAQGGFPILITTQADTFGAETVIGPGFDHRSQSAVPIGDLVFAHDKDRDCQACIRRRYHFNKFVMDMKAGKSLANAEPFVRLTTTNKEEEEEELVYLAYAPITVKGYSPVDSSDFTRGVHGQEYLIYSLGLAETHQGVLAPFSSIEQAIAREIVIAISILSVLILLSILVVVYISYAVTSSITKTILFLLELIRGINKMEGTDEPPTVDCSTGCREIVNVAQAMDALYRLVRCANTTYFAGDLEAAYKVLDDGLRLFKRLDNKKAIAVAQNNLGNICLAMIRYMDAQGELSMANMTRKEIVRKGTSYYSEAIRLGEAAYEDFYEKTGWSPECLDFMQHLSDRYFNRAMFLLTVKDKHEKPDEIQELGFRDLQIARDMDVEIVDEGEQGGWNRKERATKLFNVAISRAIGHIALQQMGYPDNWEIDQVLDQAFALLKRECQPFRGGAASDLFDSVNAVGRLQQIETELIKYHMLKGELRLAAQISIRMLIEDEFTFTKAQMQAVEGLIAYMGSLAAAAEEEDGDDNASRSSLHPATTKIQLESYQYALTRTIEEMQQRKLDSLEDMDSEFILQTMKRASVKSAVFSSSLHASGTTTTTTRRNSSMTIQEDVTMETF